MENENIKNRIKFIKNNAYYTAEKWIYDWVRFGEISLAEFNILLKKLYVKN